MKDIQKRIEEMNKKFDILFNKLLRSSSDSNETIYLAGNIPVPKGNNRDDCLYNLGLIENKNEIKSFYHQQILELIKDYGESLIETSKPIFIKNNIVDMIKTEDYIKGREELRQEMRAKLNGDIK